MQHNAPSCSSVYRCGSTEHVVSTCAVNDVQVKRRHMCVTAGTALLVLAAVRIRVRVIRLWLGLARPLACGTHVSSLISNLGVSYQDTP